MDKSTKYLISIMQIWAIKKALQKAISDIEDILDYELVILDNEDLPEWLLEPSNGNLDELF